MQLRLQHRPDAGLPDCCYEKEGFEAACGDAAAAIGGSAFKKARADAWCSESESDDDDDICSLDSADLLIDEIDNMDRSSGSCAESELLGGFEGQEEDGDEWPLEEDESEADEEEDNAFLDDAEDDGEMLSGEREEEVEAVELELCGWRSAKEGSGECDNGSCSLRSRGTGLVA